jgi:hypothetical protein
MMGLPFTLRFLFALAAVVSVVSMSDGVPEQHNMPGGYAAIPDLTDWQVQQAADFAVRALRSAEAETTSVSFHSELLSHPRLSVTVVRGFRQVVAGMNYKLVVVLTTSEPTASDVISVDDIVGGFGVTVYDRFGDLSVTKWGQEVTREQAKAMLENMNDFEGNSAGDFNH